MKQAWKVVQAELLIRLRDKSFWLEVILLPLVVTAIMGMALGSIGKGDMPKLTVGIVANSEQAVAYQVLNTAFTGAGPYKTKLFSDLETGRSALQSLRVNALVIAPDLDPDMIQKGTVLKATIESAPDGPFGAMLVAQITEATLKTLAAELGARRVVAEVMTASQLDPTSAWTTPTPVPVAARLQTVPVARFDVLAAQFAGLAIFFAIFSAFRIMSGVFSPNRRGLSLRLTALPTRPFYIAVGYIGAVAFVAAVQTFMVFLVSRVAFGVHWGSVPLLLLAAVLAAFMSASVALVLAVMPVSSTARGLIGMLVVLAGGVAGGALVPIDDAGTLLHRVAWLTPHFWVTGLFRGVARGLPPAELGGQFLAVAIYGAVALAIGAVFLKRRRAAHA